MCDKHRIESFLIELGELWKKYPDLRFGQLVMNLQATINKDLDPFYTEDDKMLQAIRFLERKKMRLIDADEAYKVLTDYYHQSMDIQHEALKEALSRVPTVDAVEIVRCKDCKYFMGNFNYCENDVWVTEMDDCYCCWGERREDDNN